MEETSNINYYSSDILPEDIEKELLEYEEIKNFELANKNKRKTRKKNLDILNEELEEIIQKNINEAKNENYLNNSESKPKKLLKRKRKYSEDSDYKEKEDDKLKLYITDHNEEESFEDEEDSNSEYDEDIKEYLKEKSNKNEKFNKFREIYEEKKKNRNKLIISFNDFNEEENYDLNNIHNRNASSKSEDTEIRKPFKKLVKNKDNKELELPLDTECIICCNSIKELANPDGCDHNFCRECLYEWAQRSDKCPICKKPYNNIFIYERHQKKKISLYELRLKYKKENKDDKDNKDEESEIEKICYICGKDNNIKKLILCYRCKANFCHIYCLKGDNKINKDKWVCQFCQDEIREKREIKKKIGHFFL